METLSIETPTHGRVLVLRRPSPAAVVVGFHGYTENADIQMDRLVSIPGADRWTLVSIQGLHRFYRGRTQEISASWMTRQDREQMIADNIEYASRAIEAAAPGGVPLFTAGFSQGVAMAFRAAIRGRRPASGIIAVGGDVPPELLEDRSAHFPRVLIVRGRSDDWYTAEKLEADAAALRARETRVFSRVLDAGHAWTDEAARAAAAFVSDGIA